VIGARGLQVRAGSFVLGPIDLTVADGDYLAVVGPSGSGKTVLLETLAGLRPAAAGRILAGDGGAADDGGGDDDRGAHIGRAGHAAADVTDLPPERRGVGLVGQQPLLFPHLTVADNIAFGPKVAAGGVARWLGTGRRRSRAGERSSDTARRSGRDGVMRDVAEALGVIPLLPRRPGSLSGGERQRVALARALAARPRALLLDEPLSALDPEGREDLQAELRRVHERFAMTVLHVTHSLDEAMAVAGRCVVLVDGRIAQDGPIDAVIARPGSAAVARLTGARNVLPATARPTADGAGCEVTLGDGLTLRSDAVTRGPVTVVLRADAVRLRGSAAAAAAAGDEAGAARVRSHRDLVAAHVVKVRGVAHGLLVTVDAGGLTVLVPRAYADGARPRVGEVVELDVPRGAVHVIPER
jgi:ABC-type sugar transport system ATPase subunit